MKKQIKISLLMTGLLSSVAAFAQSPVPAQSTDQTATTQTVTVPVVATGNAFEREVTPLLREISRKKSQLELRKLDRELERIDEESLKAQLDLENTKNGGGSGGKGNVYDPFAGMPAAAPAINPTVPSSQLSTVESPLSDIRVLMIYGFDGQLSAKIASGQQGGYVVKKGDVMPDGRIVANITSNFIEVKKGASKSKGVQRIFVSSGAEVVGAGSAPSLPGGTGSSAVLPVTAPTKMPTLSAQGQANDAAIATMMAPIPSANAK